MILTAGLTPAFQQILVFDQFTPGTVTRARTVHWCASGTGLNAARAASGPEGRGHPPAPWGIDEGGEARGARRVDHA